MKLREWLFRQSLHLTMKLSNRALINVYFPPDHEVHEFTLVFHGSKNVKPQEVNAEVYFDGVLLQRLEKEKTNAT